MFLNFGSIIIVIIVKETSSLQQDDILHVQFFDVGNKQLRPTVQKTQAIHQQPTEDLETSIGPLNLKASEPLEKLSGG